MLTGLCMKTKLKAKRRGVYWFYTPLLIIVLNSLLSCGTWINPRYVKLNKESQNELKPENFEVVEEFYNSYYSLTDSHKVYSVSSNQLKQIIRNSNKDISIVVFFGAWCGPCRINTPLVEQLQSQFIEDVNVFYVSSSDWATNSMDTDYLVNKEVKHNASFVIDIHQYGTKFTPWARINKFISNLKSDSNISEYGLPTNLIFSKNLSLLADFQEPILTDSATTIIKSYLKTKEL